MTDEDIDIIRQIAQHLADAVNGFARLQERFRGRISIWDVTQPPQRLQEWSGWLGLCQSYGHMVLHLHGWLTRLIATYDAKKQHLAQQPGPPNPDEGEELVQTPLPEWVKGVDFGQGE